MNTQIVFTIDPKVKAKAMKRAKAEGIPFAAYLRHAAEEYAEERTGFSITRPEIPNAKTAKILRATARDIKAGKNLVSFKDMKGMDDYLRSL